MENNFDKHIKKALEDLNPSAEPSDWGRMEELLDKAQGNAPELEDVYLDSVVYDRLHDMEVPYEPEHWQLMKERLNDPYALRRRLVKYKVAEVSLILLFIFTLFQYLPFESKKGHKNNFAPIAQEQHLDKTETTTSQAEQALVLSTEELEATTSNDPARDTQGSVDNGNSNTTGQLASASASYQATPVVTPNKNQEKDNIVAASTAPLTTATLNQLSRKVQDFPVADQPELEQKEYSFLDDEILADLQKIPQELLKPKEKKDWKCIFCNLNGPLRVRIGMMIGPDADYVMTPYDTRYNKAAFNQYSLGYSGGISLGLKYNRWELETGAIYSAKSYSPRNVYEVNGSFVQGGYTRQGLVSSEVDVLRIPLHLRYNILNHRKWNFYAISGASVNMAVETLYLYSTHDHGQSNTRDFGPSRNNELANQIDDYDGILEGGNLLDNTFLTANIGLGIERHFNNSRMSVFLQPIYQHQFSRGLGPQMDQINTISILTGARVTLRKKRK